MSASLMQTEFGLEEEDEYSNYGIVIFKLENNRSFVVALFSNQHVLILLYMRKIDKML